MTTPSYIIAGGESGKSRLQVLSRVLRPYSEGLFDRLNAHQWNSFLDVGCGGGDVSVMMAQKLGSNSQITGVDADEQILALAEADRQEMGLHHLIYMPMQAQYMEFDSQFDAAYARFLLSHLTDPAPVLSRMKNAVRLGAYVIVEDLEFSGHFSRPDHPAFSRYLDIYSTTVRRRGGNPEIGRELANMFRQAGLDEIETEVILPSYQSGDGKWMAWLTLDRIKAAAIREGVTTEEEIARLLDELHDFTLNPESVMSLPRITRVVGKRPVS